MGRITLFTTEHCLRSLQLKHEFEMRVIPFQEINITDFPDKRQDLFQLTRRMTTPQSFFNTRYVGGCEATLRLLKEWDKDKSFQSAAKKYGAHIARFPDPSNPHLAIPTKGTADEPRKRSPPPPLEPLTVEIALPSGSHTYEVSELQEELAQILPLSTLSYNLTSYKKSVDGTRATKALKEHYHCSNREEAEGIAKQLHRRGILHHCCYEHDFSDTSKLFFRLQCHQTPNILNSFYILEQDVANDIEKANGLVERMEHLLQQLELGCFDMDKGGIQYSRGANTAAFRELQEGLCHFQSTGIDTMLPTELLAFGLNVYNIMQRFAFFKHGIPQKDTYQRQFLRDIKFNVGGNLYNFCDWLSKISSGKVCNERPASPIGRNSLTLANPDVSKSPLKINKGHSRTSSPMPAKIIVKRPRSKSRSSNNLPAVELASSDYRVFFATNFFRSKGTAIPHFTPENIEKELNIMALAYVAEDANVSVDTNRGELHLSNIFLWYRKDFYSNNYTNPNPASDDSSTGGNSNDKELTQLVFQYMESPKKLQLQQLMYSGSGKKVKICFHSDDWTVNAVQKSVIGFTPNLIEANGKRF